MCVCACVCARVCLTSCKQATQTGPYIDLIPFKTPTSTLCECVNCVTLHRVNCLFSRDGDSIDRL